MTAICDLMLENKEKFDKKVVLETLMGCFYGSAMTTASIVCATLYQAMNQEGVHKSILTEIQSAEATDSLQQRYFIKIQTASKLS